MKIILKMEYAGQGKVHEPGETVDIPDNEAQQLINMQWATRAEDNATPAARKTRRKAGSEATR